MPNRPLNRYNQFMNVLRQCNSKPIMLHIGDKLEFEQFRKAVLIEFGGSDRMIKNVINDLILLDFISKDGSKYNILSFQKAVE